MTTQEIFDRTIERVIRPDSNEPTTPIHFDGQIAQRMDRCCERSLKRIRAVPAKPQLPRIMLAFPPAQPPTFAVTQKLRELAAQRLGMPEERLGSNGQVILGNYLRELWEENLVSPDAVGNTTGALLIPAELCMR